MSHARLYVPPADRASSASLPIHALNLKLGWCEASCALLCEFHVRPIVNEYDSRISKMLRCLAGFVPYLTGPGAPSLPQLTPCSTHNDGESRDRPTSACLHPGALSRVSQTDQVLFENKS